MSKKTLNKNISMIDAGKMEQSEAQKYNNKFFELKFLEDGVFVLRFFLNPFTSFSRFNAVVTKKLNQLYNENYINSSSITRVHEESVGNIRNYFFQLD